MVWTIRISVFVLLVAFVAKIRCPPPVARDPNSHGGSNSGSNEPSTTTHDPSLEEVDTGLEYDKYLKEVIAALEEDPKFKKHMEEATQDDWKSGKVANSLDMATHHIRTKLDEIKRKEIERLRQQLKENNNVEMQQQAPSHVDAHNPHSFEVKDLHSLIVKTTQDLEEADRQRREEFKKYEMEKEHEKRAKLQELSTDQAAQLKAKYEEMETKHKKHPQLHHPGTKAQLEEVWEKSDEMPKEDFNPKTFFMMHDTNSDGYLDPVELESLFQKELDKMYADNSTEDDPVERQEESSRMREHVMREIDVNRDGVVSLAEFMDETKKAEFNQDPGWKGLDEQELFSEEELKKYEKEQEEAKKRGQHVQPSMYGMPPPGPYYDPYQQAAMFPPGYGTPEYHPGNQGYGQHQQNMYPQGHPGNLQYQQQMMQQQQQMMLHAQGGGGGGYPPQPYGGMPQHPMAAQQYGQQQQHPAMGGGANNNHPNPYDLPPHLAAGLPPQQHQQQYMTLQQQHEQARQQYGGAGAGAPAIGAGGPALRSANLNNLPAPANPQQPVAAAPVQQQQQQASLPNLAA